MTTVGFFVGVTDYSNYVLTADTWREALTGIGRWEVVLDPQANLWPGNFAVDATVHIQINGSTQMRGYIDDILPFMDYRGDISGYDLARTRHTGRWKLVGRDFGMDLAQLYITGTWQNTRADDIIDQMLVATGSEIVLPVGVPPYVAPFIDYEANRTLLGDAIRDICQLINYDFYVADTAPPAAPILHYFIVGAPAEYTATDLYLFENVVPTISRTPILEVEVGEAVGFGVKNYVEGHAGSLMDHYTDLNGVADWVGLPALPVGMTVTDDVVSFLNGKGAIRVTNATPAAAVIGLGLSFPRYGYTDLDLHEPTMGNYNVFIHDTTAAVIKRVRINLTDNAGNNIEFYRSNALGLAKCRNCTDVPTTDEWRKIDFPLGEECGILPAIVAQQEGYWYERPAFGPAFNWYNITDIEFWSSGHPLGMNVGDYFIIDGLQFPNLEVISIQQDAVSQGTYGIRMRDIYRPDITNQVELDAFTTSKLIELSNPRETIVRASTPGQILNDYAGQSLDVVMPLFGIGGPLITDTERYRILRVHHRVVKNSDESEYPSYTFTTEYGLVKHTTYVGTFITTQQIDQPQILLTGHPDWATQEKIRVLERYRKRAGEFYPYP